MPVISISTHILDPEKKKNLIKELTAAAVNVTEIPKEKFTILINELDDVNIGISGKTLKELRALR